MTDFFQHAMEFPTIIPFGLMVFMFMFFFVSLMFGFDKNIDHSVDHSIDHSVDSHDLSSHGGFLYFIGIKSGVHTMSLLFISFFLNFMITFFISRYVDLDTTFLKQTLGIVMVIVLFPILNNLTYVLMKPLSGWMSSGERDPVGIMGKVGKVVKIFPNKKMLFIHIEGLSEEQIVYLRDIELKSIDIDDTVEVVEKVVDDGLNTMYYVKKVTHE